MRIRFERARRRLTIAAIAVLSVGAAACLDQDLTGTRASRMEVDGGDGQTVAPNTRSASPLVVQVYDQQLAFLPGQVVTWAVTSGGGSVDSPSTTTNQFGIAQTFYTAGATTGPVNVRVTVEGLGSLNFTLFVATPTGS